MSYMSFQQIAELLSVSPRQLGSRVIKRPDFPKPKIAHSRQYSRWKWAAEDVMAWARPK